MVVTENNARAQKQPPKPGPEHELLDVIIGKWSLDAVRAHLLEIAGDYAAARSSFRTAPRRTTSLP